MYYFSVLFQLDWVGMLNHTLHRLSVDLPVPLSEMTISFRCRGFLPELSRLLESAHPRYVKKRFFKKMDTVHRVRNWMSRCMWSKNIRSRFFSASPRGGEGNEWKFISVLSGNNISKTKSLKKYEGRDLFILLATKIVEALYVERERERADIEKNILSHKLALWIQAFRMNIRFNIFSTF